MNWKNVKLVVLLCLMCALGCSVATAEQVFHLDQEISFTNVSWKSGGQHNGPAVATKLVSSPLKVGERSLELAYDFLGVEGQINNCAYTPVVPLFLPGTTEVLRIWLYGDSSGHCLILRLQDEGGQTLQYWGVPINWSGWKLVEFKLGAPPQGYWGGANDGVIHGKVSISSFLIESRPQTAVAKGKIYMGGVSVVSQVKESESVRLDVTSSKLGNIFTEKEKIQFLLRFDNYLPQSRQLNVRYWVETTNDRAFPRSTMAITLGATGKTSQELTIDNFNLNGCFNLHLQISSSDQKIMFKKVIPFSRCVAPSEKPRANILSAQTHFAHGLGRYPLKENMELLRLSGVAWYRDEMFWEYAELKKGEVKVLPEWDERIEKSLQSGLKPLLELNSGNSHHGGGVPVTEEQLAAWGNYVRQLALHFRGKINHFEIWNEFNGGMGLNYEQRGWTLEEKARHYMDILQVAYKKIKEVAPEATVVGCATAGVDLPWIEEVFKAGGLSYMDAISVHAYPGHPTPEEGGAFKKLQQLKELMERYGTIKPIWITETGVSTHLNSTGVTELQAAAFAVRQYVLTLASKLPVALFSWYDLHNDGTDPYNAENNFGLVNASSGVEVPFAAKQNFIAFTAMNRMLEDAAFLEKLETDPEMYGYKFSLPSQKQLLVLWTLNHQATATIGIKTSSSRVDFVDLFGNRFALYPINGIVTVTVSNEPLYLVGDFPNSALCEPPFSLIDHAFNSFSGETVTVRIQGSKAAAEVERLLIDLPREWTVKEQKGFSADSLQAYFTINVPSGIEEKTYIVPIYLLGKERVLAQLQAIVSIKRPLVVELNPSIADPSDWRKWNIAVTVINQSTTRSNSGSVKLLEPLEFVKLSYPLGFSLAPNERQTIDIPLTTVSRTAIPVKVEVTSSHGDEVSVEKNMSFLAAIRCKSPLTVDGEISEGEWGKAMPFAMDQANQVKEISNWGGPEDVSGIGYLQWDDEYLYLAVQAKDDVFVQNGTGSDLWSGDSVQFAVDPARKTQVGAEGFHEFGFALGKSGVIGWRWGSTWSMVAEKTPGPLPKTVRLAVIRKGNTTCYEAAIPWSELMVTKPQIGTVIGFSLLINDSDASDRGWIEYMGGIGLPKEASLFGDLLLSD